MRRPSQSQPFSQQAVADSVRWYSGEDIPTMRRLMYAVINALQDEPPRVQVIAPAVALVTMCDAAGLDPHEVITQVNNMRANLDAPFAYTIDAAKAYVEGELL